MALDDAKMLELEDGRLMPCVRMEPDNVMDVVEILVRKTREGAATEG